nr:response regulator [Kofleriaceae bacterium]
MLVVDDDGDALDALTRLFEHNGFEVVTAVTGYRAQAILEGGRPVHVVVAPWDAERAMGGDVYRWALQHRFDLRGQFVFVAAGEVPATFDAVVAGRCLAVPASQPAEIVRVAVAAVKRRSALESVPDPVTDIGARPSLLIADDEPVLLRVMAELMETKGYRVVQAESGSAAVERMEDSGNFDVIVCDWQMDGGGGEEVYAWIKENKPWLGERIVFLSGGERDDAQTAVPGRPMFRKGQDSRQLIEVLREIVRQVRAEASGLSFLPD